MKPRHHLWFLLGMVALFSLTPSAAPDSFTAAAAEPPDEAAAGGSELLPSLLERPTVLLVDVDLAKLDVPAIIAWAVQRSGLDEAARPPQQVNQMAVNFVESMKTAGAGHVYLSVATRSFHDGGPLIIIPCDDGAAVTGLVSMLVQGGGADSLLQVRSQPGVVLAGPEKVLDRLAAAVDQQSGEVRDDLLEPLRDRQRMDHVAVLSLAESYRRELIALWPDSLPKAAPIQVSPRQLARDVRRIVMSWSLPPELAMEVKLQTDDASAADRVQETLERVLAQFSDQLAPDAGVHLPTLEREANDVKLLLSAAVIESWLDQMQQLSPWGNAKGRANHLAEANKLKQIGLAMHAYLDRHEHFPPKYFVDPQGQPLFSWRVAILPFIEQQALYESFQLAQAWDSAANASVTSKIIATYADPLVEQPTQTRFRVPIFPGSAWDGDGPPKTLRDITDGTSNTIAVIQTPVEAAVHWADPAAWVLSADNLLQDVFGDRDEVLVLAFDGAVHTLRRAEMDREKLAALLTIAGGEQVSW